MPMTGSSGGRGAQTSRFRVHAKRTPAAAAATRAAGTHSQCRVSHPTRHRSTVTTGITVRVTTIRDAQAAQLVPSARSSKLRRTAAHTAPGLGTERLAPVAPTAATPQAGPPPASRPRQPSASPKRGRAGSDATNACVDSGVASSSAVEAGAGAGASGPGGSGPGGVVATRPVADAGSGPASAPASAASSARSGSASVSNGTRLGAGAGCGSGSGAAGVRAGPSAAGESAPSAGTPLTPDHTASVAKMQTLGQAMLGFSSNSKLKATASRVKAGVRVYLDARQAIKAIASGIGCAVEMPELCLGPVCRSTPHENADVAFETRGRRLYITGLRESNAHAEAWFNANGQLGMYARQPAAANADGDEMVGYPSHYRGVRNDLPGYPAAPPNPFAGKDLEPDGALAEDVPNGRDKPRFMFEIEHKNRSGKALVTHVAMLFSDPLVRHVVVMKMYDAWGTLPGLAVAAVHYRRAAAAAAVGAAQNPITVQGAFSMGGRNLDHRALQAWQGVAVPGARHGDVPSAVGHFTRLVPTPQPGSNTRILRGHWTNAAAALVNPSFTIPGTDLLPGVVGAPGLEFSVGDIVWSFCRTLYA